MIGVVPVDLIRWTSVLAPVWLLDVQLQLLERDKIFVEQIILNLMSATQFFQLVHAPFHLHHLILRLIGVIKHRLDCPLPLQLLFDLTYFTFQSFLHVPLGLHI